MGTRLRVPPDADADDSSSALELCLAWMEGGEGLDWSRPENASDAAATLPAVLCTAGFEACSQCSPSKPG